MNRADKTDDEHSRRVAQELADEELARQIQNEMLSQEASSTVGESLFFYKKGSHWEYETLKSLFGPVDNALQIRLTLRTVSLSWISCPFKNYFWVSRLSIFFIDFSFEPIKEKMVAGATALGDNLKKTWSTFSSKISSKFNGSSSTSTAADSETQMYSHLLEDDFDAIHEAPPPAPVSKNWGHSHCT
jgi:hypothetical protein